MTACEELDVIMTVEIPVRNMSHRILLSQAVGTATLGDEEMTISQAIAGGSLMFNFRGQSYLVCAQDLIEAIWASIIGE